MYTNPCIYTPLLFLYLRVSSGEYVCGSFNHGSVVFFVNSLSDRSCFHYNISVYLVNPIIHSKPVSELLNCTPRRNNVCEQEETSLMLKPCTHGTSFGIFKFPGLHFLSLNVLYLHFHQCFLNCRFPRIRKTL